MYGRENTPISTPITLVIRPPRSTFRASLRSARQVVAVGQSARTPLITTIGTGLAETMWVRVLHVPKDVRVTVSRRSLQSGQSTFVTVKVIKGARPGRYRIFIGLRGHTHSVGLSDVVVVRK